MPLYLVTWKIHVDADSPKEAATKAREIQKDPSSLATVFTVEDPDKRGVQIDLLGLIVPQ